ncbi:uncharacterized protein N0V89_002353 [Didymosphaeria variabile]|uniref:F-box domain-containing protein n=1 Tax=Didymosphaeria variabile TaxID=1932322 RepID=A0A9W8XRH9_9PLEO|nr:uncharacterized protein N0V89_002353 [Didymosphaeria variabile]KAJ4357777.1 hypothetical protein N0V89_002353 [Didymosphaeria variabile]
MVNSKDFAFRVNKQTPANGSLPPAYGTVIDCRPAHGRRGRSEKEVKSRPVRLTRVPGPHGVECKKRKRDGKDFKNDDGTATASKESSVDTMSTASVSTASTERPLVVRKSQPAPTRFRRGTVLKKQVDLDSWFTILRFSDPAQLLEMRTRIASCYRFLRDNPMLWKHSRDHSYDDSLPDPPSVLSEFQYAHLRHGHGCMSCHKPSTRKTYWAFLRRWCKTCLHSKIVKEHEVIAMLKEASEEHVLELLKCLPVAIFDSWENYVGVGPGNTHPQKNVYILQDVENLLAEHGRERDENPATWHAECRVWMSEKEKVIQERHDFARKMEFWEDHARQVKSSDFQEKKMARKKYFKERAAELTPPITEKELQLCPSYRRAVVIPKMPNMLSWSQLKPKVEKEAADVRKRCSTPDPRRLPDPMSLARERVQHGLPFFSHPSSRTTTPSTDPFF